ncbi:hypothetical protein K438DRAFT_1778884 [Mycena galopus ATCC 62051]|nr:hypothetical protein K438DRAFT_1778884 [Mycena galopus ATCC 62051]
MPSSVTRADAALSCRFQKAEVALYTAPPDIPGMQESQTRTPPSTASKCPLTDPLYPHPSHKYWGACSVLPRELPTAPRRRHPTDTRNKNRRKLESRQARKQKQRYTSKDKVETETEVTVTGRDSVNIEIQMKIREGRTEGMSGRTGGTRTWRRTGASPDRSATLAWHIKKVDSAPGNEDRGELEAMGTLVGGRSTAQASAHVDSKAAHIPHGRAEWRSAVGARHAKGRYEARKKWYTRQGRKGRAPGVEEAMGGGGGSVRKQQVGRVMTCLWRYGSNGGNDPTQRAAQLALVSLAPTSAWRLHLHCTASPALAIAHHSTSLTHSPRHRLTGSGAVPARSAVTTKYETQKENETGKSGTNNAPF